MADDPIAFWNGPGAARWVTQQERFDRAFAAHGELAMEAARLTHGSRVLDIGCGCGSTTLSLGARVAPGTVLGVDVSEPMLARAKERSEGVKNVAFARGDATVFSFEPASFDVACSRFGVMFFVDPVRAFTNIRSALVPGGRLAMVVWRAIADNPWMHEPSDAVRGILELPPETPPDQPGPFSFGNADRVRRILAQAGFEDVDLVAREPLAVLSASGDREDALQTAMAVGAVGRALQGADDATRERVREPLLAWIARYSGPDGVRVPTGVWVITATTR